MNHQEPPSSVPPALDGVPPALPICAASPAPSSAATGPDVPLEQDVRLALDPQQAAPRRERSGFVEALVLVLVALVMALSLKTYVAEAYEIRGRSMEDTFHNGQRVVVLKSFFEIARGDIIVFASSEDPNKDLIKRVVGLPGETVRIFRGDVFINGKKIDEAYAKHDARDRRAQARTETIKPGHYYVLGDNRPDSHDSRAFEAIAAGSIRGKVIACWWPLADMKAF